MAHILIIDDDLLFLKWLRHILEHAGHKVIEALNGEVGIKLFREERTDLVITDIFMPEKEGLETIRELKRDFLGVKIIAISGGGNRKIFSFLDVAQGLGADRAFAKPFKQEDMLTAIQELIE